MTTHELSYAQAHYHHHPKITVVHQFLDWCKSQEKNRLLWLAIIVTGHGCIITPFTALAVMSSGNSMFCWALIIAAMGMSLVTNLAALPTKITIPIFFLSLLIDLAVIINFMVIAFTGA